jgi:HEAT repeat protein
MNVNATPNAPGSVEELIKRIKNPNDAAGGPAWQGAAACGAEAIQPLAELLLEPDMEVARSAKRALYCLTRHAGRPGADAEARAVEAALLPLLAHEKSAVSREVLWVLSEIGSDRAVAPMAALLANEQVREDARCALLRLPGERPTAALRAAFRTAPEDFKYALADSLRQRGLEVEGYPSRKLVPSRQTTVTPIAPKPK